MSADKHDTPEVWFTAYRLYQGGIKDMATIAAIIGVKIHGQKLRAGIRRAEQLLELPFPIATPVRCSHCGCATVSIPCAVCGDRATTYRIIKRPTKPPINVVNRDSALF